LNNEYRFFDVPLRRYNWLKHYKTYVKKPIEEGGELSLMSLVLKEVLHSFVLIQKNQKIKAYKTLWRQYSQIVSAGG
jgi:hypothetical protein